MDGAAEAERREGWVQEMKVVRCMRSWDGWFCLFPGEGGGERREVLEEASGKGDVTGVSRRS